ncbi:unnamed protein product, partial [Eruca vesicaria subsp. sativa]|nr:unnamed protein product [Eruca vesicaria subsp. sativa]
VYTDEHALFLTFSNDFPLSEMQILNYFNGYYGPYVEGVNVHTPRERSGHPCLEKLLLRIPALLMQSHGKIYFIVEGRHLSCK